MQPTWEAQWEIYCHTNKHTHNQDPEKVQWESRCQFSHAALMRARTVKKSARVFSELRATAFLTASGRNSTPTPEQEPVTCIEKWGNATIMSPLTESCHVLMETSLQKRSVRFCVWLVTASFFSMTVMDRKTHSGELSVMDWHPQIPELCGIILTESRSKGSKHPKKSFKCPSKRL